MIPAYNRASFALHWSRAGLRVSKIGTADSRGAAAVNEIRTAVIVLRKSPLPLLEV